MALTNLVLPLLLTYVNQTPTHFEKLINTIVDDEDLPYIQIIKDASVDIPSHFYRITKDTPIVIMDISKPVNFLDQDFPNETLAYSFHAKTMFIFFVEAQVSRYRMEAIHRRTEFFMDAWIIIVLPNNSSESNKFDYVQAFHDIFHVNIIALDLKSFEAEKKYYSMSLFPTFKKEIKTFVKAPPMKTNAMNAQGKRINFLCTDVRDYCSKSPRHHKTLFGIHYYMIREFTKFINADIKVYHKNDRFKHVDYNSSVGHLPYNLVGAHSKFMIYHWKKSIITTRYSLDVVVPTPVEMAQKYYIIRPFTSEIWITLTSFIIYTSVLLKLTFIVIKKESELMNLIGEVIKALLGQSINFKQKKRMVTVIQVMLIVFSFIVNIWYLSILGSFLTTHIYEKHLETVDDLHEYGTPMVMYQSYFNRFVDKDNQVSGNFFNSEKKLAKLKDQIEITQNETLFFSLIMKERYAFIMDSFRYENTYYPLMRFYNNYKFEKTDILLADSFHVFQDDPYSPYKTAFRRFVSLISDVGLLQYWQQDRSFIDRLQFNSVKLGDRNNFWDFHKDTEPVVVLTLDYFLYIYLLWVLGVVMSILAFCCEMVWHYKMKTKCLKI